MQSEQIDQIATALAKAQAELKNPPKSKIGKVKSDKGSYEYAYVDFAEGLDLIRPVLGAHGLSFVQVTELNGNVMTLRTRLLHASGQFLESVYPVCSVGAHQAMGSALSYSRRYALFSLIGIAGEDDNDGEHAAQAAPAKPDLNAEAAAYVARAKTEMANFDKLPDLVSWWQAEKKNRELYRFTKESPLGSELLRAYTERGEALSPKREAAE